jgi:CubicO group peptidase (beta-lactamase class C family)
MRPPLFILILLSCCPATVIAGAQTPPDPKLAGLRERWTDIMKELDVPGAAIVAVRGDQVVLLEPLGVRSVDSNEPVTPDTFFYIASCTKSFMAMAVLTLVEEGKIELDAPVKRYLPQFRTADEELSEKLTVRDLLCHAKGLNSGNITFGEAYSGDMTDERYWRMMRSAKARGSFAYSNLHYTILGRLVQRVTGTHWKDFVEQRVCKPAGMNRTTAYASRMYGDADAALPSIYWDGKLITAPQRKTDRTMHAAGGMGSTANDLGRWMILNLGEGQIDGTRILSADLTRQMQTIQAEADHRNTPIPHMSREGYGLGWEIGKYRDQAYIQHGGGYVGTAALVTMIPESDVGVAVIVNTDAGGAVFAAIATADVLDRLLGAEPLDLIDDLRPRHANFRQRRAEQAASATQPATADALSLPPAAYVGAYHNEDLGTIQITQRDGRLMFQLGDLRPLLFAGQGKDQLIAVFSGGVIDGVRFELDGKRVSALVMRSGDDEDRFKRK